MHREIFRQVLCIILSFLMFGCSGTYNLNLHSEPSGVAVQVGPDVQGRTPCNIEIPKDSDSIKHHRIDVKYTLENGREIIKTYDLRKYEPPNQIATIIGASIAAPGVLGFALTETNEDDNYTSFDKEDSNRTELRIRLFSLGLVGVGALICYTFGGSFNSDGYDIYETFEDANEVSIN